jgi:PKD repeat protein
MKKQMMRFYCACLALLAIAGCNNGDDTVTPPMSTIRITSVSPNKLSLGASSVPLVIKGAGFSASNAVDLGIGIEIISKTITDSVTIGLTVNVSRNASAGPRTVVVSSSGSSARLEGGLTIDDNRAPVANFIINPTEGTINSTFQLDASNSSDEDGSIGSYKWQISDGTNLQGKRTQKKFDVKGTYTIQLTVTDNKGGISNKAKQLDVGDNLPPLAAFTVTPSSGTQLTTFTFDASTSSDSDGEIRGYLWDFGGKTENGRIVQHRFTEGGSFRVELQVKDTQGAVSSDHKTIHVEFFDKEKAIEEISDVLVDFLRQFDKLEVLPAEDIVRGFSTNRDCRGRTHELGIIENEQNTIRSGSVEILGDPVVSYVDDKTGRASITARFYGTMFDGTDYDGIATHNFTMINESDGWQICNFSVVGENATFLPSFITGN